MIVMCGCIEPVRPKRVAGEHARRRSDMLQIGYIMALRTANLKSIADYIYGIVNDARLTS